MITLWFNLAFIFSLVLPAVQQKDSSPVNTGSGTSTSSLAGDFLTPPASADVAADIAKYTTKVSHTFTSEVNTVKLFH